jgi:hypothetical protein
VEEAASVIDARAEVELASNEPVDFLDTFDPIAACATRRRAALAKKNDTDVFDFDAFLGLETQIAEKKKEEEELELKTPKKKGEQDSCDYLTALLLEQNRFLINQLADQNKYMIDRLATPSISLCAACGAEDQKLCESEKRKWGAKKKSGEKEKSGAKQSKSLFWNVDIVIRRILRIFSLILLVVIAVQLGFIRGETLDGKSGRRTGFFGR